MLDVFIREPLASWTLGQSYVSPSNSPCRLDLRPARRASLCTILSGFNRGIGGGTPLVAAVENVVELRNWISAFDADGHAKVLHRVKDP